MPSALAGTHELPSPLRSSAPLRPVSPPSREMIPSVVVVEIGVVVTGAVVIGLPAAPVPLSALAPGPMVVTVPSGEVDGHRGGGRRRFAHSGASRGAGDGTEGRPAFEPLPSTEPLNGCTAELPLTCEV